MDGERLAELRRDRGISQKELGVMFKPDMEHKLSKTNIPKTVRFTEKLDEELRKLHTTTGISFNQLVLQCCQYALQYEERNPKS